jgi:hypothetical protein
MFSAAVVSSANWQELYMPKINKYRIPKESPTRQN